MPEIRGQLLPVYVMADESLSMKPYLGELNAGLRSLHETLHGEPMIAAKVRLAVLGFSDNVMQRLELCDARTMMQMPNLVIRAGTSYAAAFDDLARRIPADIGRLKADQYAVHRPAVFFLSDGQPTDRDPRAWTAPHDRLVDRTQTAGAPNIIACGIGDAEAQTILDVATSPTFAFISTPGADIGRSIAQFFGALTASIVSSGSALASGDPRLVVERPESFSMAIDLV